MTLITLTHIYTWLRLSKKWGKTQEAIRAYRRVLALDPHNKFANDRLKANETMPDPVLDRYTGYAMTSKTFWIAA